MRQLTGLCLLFFREAEIREAETVAGGALGEAVAGVGRGAGFRDEGRGGEVERPRGALHNPGIVPCAGRAGGACG